MHTRPLLFGIHMHQPVDNFDWVIKKAIDEAYMPFFKIAQKYPKFVFAVHCSGWLLEQIMHASPKLFSMMQTMAQHGQIELFTAGFYEPILSTISSIDRRDQIEKLNDFLYKHFGQKPKGAWLTERVWESALVPDLAHSSVAYTVVDDYHFMSAGFDEDNLSGYHTTEEGGVSMGLFAISKKLRYAIPFMSVQKAIDAIYQSTQKPNQAAVLFDDAEKFGMWPKTYEWVYTKGWLESFIQAVLEDAYITPMHFSDYYENYASLGVAYLPNVSYYEMGQWSLDSHEALALEALKEQVGNEYYEREGVKFIKGSVFKNFLVKYPQSNHIHKRMLAFSNKRSAINDKAFDDALFRLQTNDVFWHGVFGGLYLPNLRDNAYSYVARCEAFIKPDDACIDVSFSATQELFAKIYSDNGVVFVFNGRGQLVECTYIPKRFNYVNVLTRKHEAYHEAILHPKAVQESYSQEEGIDTIHNSAIDIDEHIKEALVYDWYEKYGFVDHISDAHVTHEHLQKANFKEYGCFANQDYEMVHEKNSLTFTRAGGIYDNGTYFTQLDKSFVPTAKGIQATITLKSQTAKAYTYVLEHVLHCADYEKVHINGQAISSITQLDNANHFEIIDSFLKVRITIALNKEATLMCAPLQTVSQSESGFDVSMQGYMLGFKVPFISTLELISTWEIEDV